MYPKKGEILLVLVLLLLLGTGIYILNQGGITSAATTILPATGEIGSEEDPINITPATSPELLPEPSLNLTQVDEAAVDNTTESSPTEEVSPTLTLQSISIKGAASATSCGEVTASLTLTSDVSSGGSCFNISASKVAIDCAGRRITYGSAGTGGYGINNSEGYDNLIIKNCEIVEGSVSGDSQFAVYFMSTINSTIENNTINTSGTTSHAIYLVNDSNFTTIHLNTITTNGSNSAGIYLARANASRILYNNITTSGSTAYSLYLSNSSGNNTFTTNSFSSGTAFEILDESGNDIVNYLIYNNTFGEIRWLDNGTENFLQNLTLNGTIGPDANIFIDYNIIAVNTSAFAPVRINNTVTNITFFGISLNTATGMLKLHDFSTSNPEVRNDGFNCNATSCPITLYSNTTGVLMLNTSSLGSFAANGTMGCNQNVARDFTLDRNVSAVSFLTPSLTDFCFRPSSSNLVFDCRKHYIFGNGSGVGIRGSSSSVIKNCRISGFQRGSSATGFTKILNNQIWNTSSEGISVSSLSNNITGNIIYDSTSGISFLSNENHSLTNNTLYSNNFGLNIGNARLNGTNIKSNNFSYNRMAVYVETGLNDGGGQNASITFEDNLYFNNTYGVVIMSGGQPDEISMANYTFISERFIRDGNATFFNLTTGNNIKINNILFRDSLFANNTQDIGVDSMSADALSDFNITFVNTTINKSRMSVPRDSYAYFKTIVDVNVTDSDLNPLENVSVVTFDSVGEKDSINETDITGISRLLVTEAYRNNNINYYLTPTKIEVNKSNYTRNSTTARLFNLSYKYINFTLTRIDCGSTAPSSFDLGNNYICAGDGFTIGDDNIIINGKGFNLSGSNTGTGINFNDKSNITIQDLGVRNFTTGLHIVGSNNSNLTNIEVIDNNRGIVFNNSNNNSVYDSTIGSNVEMRILGTSDRTTNNSIVNGSMDFNNITVSGSETIFIRWYVNVNATFNDRNALPDATVSGYFNRTQVIDDSAVTSSNGIGRLKLSEFSVNSSGRTYLTPHNVTLLFDYLGTNITNSTVINLSQTNSTVVVLNITLNCTVPSTDLFIANNTDLCPGTFQAHNISLSSNLTLTCIRTTIKGDAANRPTIDVQSRQNITITGCTFEDSHIINIHYSRNVSIKHSTISVRDENGAGIYILNSVSNTIGLHTIDNVTIIGKSGEDQGIIIQGSDNNTVQRSNFTDNGIGILLNPSQNSTIRNNTFYGIRQRAVSLHDGGSGRFSAGNSFYHNVFSDQLTRYFGLTPLYENITFLNNTFNTTVGNLTQGNQYRDYCDKGKDLNDDGYADTNSTLTAADWPYNQTVAGSLILVEGGTDREKFVDYGPRIITCPSDTVFLGSSDSRRSCRHQYSPPAGRIPCSSPAAGRATSGRNLLLSIRSGPIPGAAGLQPGSSRKGHQGKSHPGKYRNKEDAVVPGDLPAIR